MIHQARDLLVTPLQVNVADFQRFPITWGIDHDR